MWSTARRVGAALEIALAAGYVLWLVRPGHAPSGPGLVRWAVVLAISAAVGEAGRRQGHHDELSAVARVTGLLMLLVALGLFGTVLGIEAALPSLDF